MKLRWNNEEIEEVVSKAAELVKAGDVFEAGGWIGVFQKAQARLPQSRQRTNWFYGTLKPLRRMVDARLKVLNAIPETPPPETPPPPVVPEVPPLPPGRLSFHPQVTQAMESLVSGAVFLLDQGIKAGAESFGRSFGEAVGKNVGEAVAKALYDIRYNMGLNGIQHLKPADAMVPVEVEEEEEKIKPKLAVVGLIGPQIEVIRRKFPEVDFRFFDGKGKRAVDIRNVVASCDAAFLMSKFISHSDQGAVLKGCKSSGRKNVWVNGSATELERSIKVHFPAVRPAAHH